MKFDEHEPSFGSKLHLSLDFRVITMVLLVVIAVMLIIWKPWSGPNANDRTIEVRGESSISATPDEFVFYPSYEFKNADKTAALAEMSKKSDEIVAKLKGLGVAEADIKTSSTGYDDKGIRPVEPTTLTTETTTTNTYTLSLTVTVTDESLVQKVQDYLVSTSPTGTVSPLANFSDEKRKALERAARSAAISEAKSKADQTAQKLGFEVGEVKTVSDGTGFSTLPAEARSSDSTTSQGSSLGVHPGENELPYAVTVVYFIR